MKNHSFVLAFSILNFLFLSNCTSTKVIDLQKPKNTLQTDFSQIKRSTAQSYNDPLIRMDFKAGELKAACEANISALNLYLDTEIRNVFDLDRVLTNFKDTMLSLTFMAYVHKDKIVRGEGSACEENSNKALVSLFAKRKLFERVNATATQTTDEDRLKSEFKREFLKYGMNLNDADLSQFIKLKSELVKLESEFTKNLNEDTSYVLFSKSELAGASKDFISRLKKVRVVEHDKKLIKYKVTTKSTDYIEVLENVKVSKTREILNAKYENRVAKENTELLEKAVDLRHEIAKLLKYKNWADYKIEGRMAKDSDHVMNLLSDLRVRLRPRLEKDLQVLLQAKQKLEDPKASSLSPWDIRYFENQLKKSVYSVDTEVIREYFPKDQVMKGLFEVYSTLLHVHYDEVASAKVWAVGVKLYAIRENSTNDIIGYFYADLIPREGKYSHAAAFTLLNGRVLESGLYSQPVSAIVANFSPPTKDKPSLLTHDEVETLFHEFGHIMHQTITKAPYGSLS
ncbi:MAG: M3 family metallopeptidase, partial [Bdellovibrionales bacterium]